MPEVIYQTNTVKEFYDKKYSNFRSLPSFDSEELRLKKIIYNISKKYKIELINYNSYLDIGCGFGIKTYILSQLFKKALGIDLSSNAINIAGLLNDNPNLKFKYVDFHQMKTEAYDIITAFGLSILNIHNISVGSEEIKNICHQYLKPEGILIIGSFTDFSGKAPTGWVNYTKKDLKQLIIKINNFNNLKCQIYFVHKDISNYFGYGLKNLLIEIIKLFFTKKRDYFLIIKKNA